MLTLNSGDHPVTVKLIQRSKVPLRLKNVKSPSGAGTDIFPSIYLVPSIAAESQRDCQCSLIRNTNVVDPAAGG